VTYADFKDLRYVCWLSRTSGSNSLRQGQSVDFLYNHVGKFVAAISMASVSLSPVRLLNNTMLKFVSADDPLRSNSAAFGNPCLLTSCDIFYILFEAEYTRFGCFISRLLLSCRNRNNLQLGRLVLYWLLALNNDLRFGRRTHFFRCPGYFMHGC